MSSLSPWNEVEGRIAANIHLARRPVAVAILDSRPPTVQKFSGTGLPAAASGAWPRTAVSFYTVPGDHFNCAVGAYIHNICIVPASREGNREDSEDDVRPRLRQAGGGPTDPTLGKVPGCDRLLAVGRITSDAGCGFVCLQADCGHAPK